MELTKEEYAQSFGEPPLRRASRIEIQQKERTAWAEFQRQKRE